MKILCVIDSLGPGGAQRQLVELSLGFKERGHQVSFLTYHPQEFYRDLLESNGIGNVCIQESNYLKRLLKMRTYIRRGNFDSIISFLQASNFICEIAGFPFKNWNLIVGERSANPNIFKSLKLISYRWFHLFADYVVANSTENLKMVHKLNPFLTKQKCRVIYNMVSPSLFLIENKYSRTENDVLHIIVGASHRYLKNSVGMVNAFLALSPAQRKKIKISWYGESITSPFVDNSFTETLEIIKNSHLEDKIGFYPATQNFIEHLAQADIVALFSFYEGLPNVICEAMALGKPVLVSRVSDLPVLLKHNLQQTFNPIYISQIKESIEYYLNLEKNDFLKIGEQNRGIAKEKFCRETIINQYLELMEG